jgi:hypothetical protein
VHREGERQGERGERCGHEGAPSETGD